MQEIMFGEKLNTNNIMLLFNKQIIKYKIEKIMETLSCLKLNFFFIFWRNV